MKLDEIHIDLPLEFDVIHKALKDGKVVTFQSLLSNGAGLADGEIIGRVISIERSLRRADQLTMSYNEWLGVDKAWDTGVDKTIVTFDELEQSTFEGRADGGLHVIIPNHDIRQ